MMKNKVFLLLLFCCTLAVGAWSQSKTITGKVSDAKGAPLANASIVAKGSVLGTTTNDDGAFSLTVPANARTLVISAVGYGTKEVNVSVATSIAVNLEVATEDLDEVVVVAYGTVKKKNFVGAASSVSAKDIEQRPVANVTRALEGNVPGVVVTTGSGQPGSGSAVRVRGFGSINATQEPLYVVDGVPYVGGLSNLNPDDIESMNVLKDASATSLYGARAGNGVVLITTKRGKKGRNNMSVKVLAGISTRGLPEYDRVDAYGYYPLMWEAYRNSLVYRTTGAISLDSANRVASGLTSRNGIDALLAYNPFNVPRNTIVRTDGTLNPVAQLLWPDDVDWTDNFMRDGSRNEYNLNFNGGAEKSDYFVSLAYLKEKGFTRNTDFERFSTRINLNVNPLKWLKTGVNIGGNYSNANSASEDGAIANPFQFSRNIGSIYPYWARNQTTGQLILDAQGNRIWDLGNFQNEPIGIQNGIRNRPGTTAGRHAPAELELNQDKFRRLVATVRQYTEVVFLRNFKFTANFGFDYQTQFDEGYENQLVGDGAPAGRLDKELTNNQALTATQLLNYNKRFGKHSVDALAGHESFNQRVNGMRGFRQGQSLAGNTEFANFTTINTLTSYTDFYRLESWFGRVNYDFDGLLFATGSVRRDGNSRFAPESRWGTFWSVGGGVSLDRLNFIQNQKWINSLKLRGSYGTVGVADGIGLYAWQGLYNFNNNAGQSGIAQSQTSIENRKLTWEVNKQAGIGLDYAILRGRISGSFDWYNRVSSDLLFRVPTPLSSGTLSLLQNTATLYNRGIELAINGQIIKEKNFGWNMGVQISTVRNRITQMPEKVPEFIDGTKKYAVGASIFDYWLRTYRGVDSDDGSALYTAQNTRATSGIRIKPNKNGGNDTLTTDINNAKFEYQGGVIPEFYGAMTQEIRIYGFTLSAMFTFQKGGRTFDAAYQGLMSSGTYGSAIHADIQQRWQKPGDVTNVPRMDNGQTVNFNATSSRWLIDASYFNIRTINLTYAIPRSILAKYRISSANVFVSAENVAFFSKRRGMNNQAAFSGITNSAYPPARIISGGINLNL
jgi:TonB-linked SusC/RagA family outer membrane protein